MRISRLAVAAGAAASIAALGTTPAFAHHPHVIQTPGTCVDKNGEGFGTGEPHDAPSFHSQVHMGKPGTSAFQNPHNPVAVVGKTLCP